MSSLAALWKMAATIPVIIIASHKVQCFYDALVFLQQHPSPSTRLMQQVSNGKLVQSLISR